MGEFKKRIKEFLKVTETEDEVLNIISPKPFLEIVEEAKREFPDPHEAPRDLIQSWFERWFGAEKLSQP